MKLIATICCIKHIRIYAYTHIRIYAYIMDDMPEETCPICLIPITSTENLYRTPCNHAFCRSCVGEMAKRDWDVPCPMCRSVFIPSVDIWKHDSVHTLFHRMQKVIGSEESRRLQLTPELVGIVKYMIMDKERKLLNHVRENRLDEEFNIVYDHTILKGKKYFAKIEDPFENFALAWLYYKYH
jgi:Ring finger domain